MGRPSGYSQELADRICSELSGGRSLRSVCEDEGMPDRVTVFRWLREHESFCSQYARAKEEAADALADEMLDIADSTDDPQSRRVRVDTRKWIASKLKPKRYGDRMQLAGDDESPLRVEIVKLTDANG